MATGNAPHENETDRNIPAPASNAETTRPAAASSRPTSLNRRTFITGATASLLVLGTGALAVAARRGGVGGPGVPEIPSVMPPTATATSPGPVAVAPTIVPTATPGASEAASSYVATAPRTLRSGGVETIAFTLANGDRPTTTKVAVALLKDGKTVASGEEWIRGRGSVPLGVPNLAAGDYTLRVSGRGFTDEGAVRVEAGAILFLESDKPIYKPGETVRLRVLALNSALRPVAGQATVEAADAKGIKIFRKIVAVDEWGMATLELPLSTEPNLGVWKLRAMTGTGAGASGTQLDIRVERYVLPKYEVKVTLPKAWALVTETITGTIGAEYSFGKPVKGEATIVALRYQGTWQEYARLTRPVDGTATFEIPAARYSAGSPGNGGAGAVRLDVTVREAATDYEEQHSTLVTIVAAPVAVRLIPESGSFKPGLPLGLLVVAAGPDGKAGRGRCGADAELPGRRLQAAAERDAPGDDEERGRHAERHAAGRRGGPLRREQLHGARRERQAERHAADPARVLLPDRRVLARRATDSGGVERRRAGAVPGDRDERGEVVLLRDPVARQGRLLRRGARQRDRGQPRSGDGPAVEAGRLPDLARRRGRGRLGRLHGRGGAAAAGDPQRRARGGHAGGRGRGDGADRGRGAGRAGGGRSRRLHPGRESPEPARRLR